MLKLIGRSNSDLLEIGDESVAELGPDGLGNVEAREGGALLPLVLEGGADALLDGTVDVG